MNKKITCSLAHVTHISNVLSVTANNCEVENELLKIRLFSDQKIVYESSTEPSDAGTIQSETVSIETTADDVDYQLLNNLKYYIVIVSTVEGQLIVGNLSFPCSKVINTVDNKKTITFTSKKPL